MISDSRPVGGSAFASGTSITARRPSVGPTAGESNGAARYSAAFEDGALAPAASPTFIDLFCGAGGFSAGFVLAGFECLGAFDKDAKCIETHKRNFPRARAHAVDLATVEPSAYGLANRVDVVIGSPPCQTFSNIGAPKLASLPATATRLRDDPLLFRHYFRWVQEIQPRVFVMENVPQFLTKGGRSFGTEAMELGRQLGYTCTAAVLDAAEFGVPQRRRRAIIIGVRPSISGRVNLDAVVSGRRPPHTVGDALDDLPTITDDWRVCTVPYSREPVGSYARSLRTASGLVSNNRCRVSNERAKRVFPHLLQGMKYGDLPAEIRAILPFREDIFHDRLKRLVESEPAWTIIAHIGMDGYMYIHPRENRTLSVREAARLQSFPDAFHFVGNMRQQYVQVGNAVAPIMALGIASAIGQVF